MASGAPEALIIPYQVQYLSQVEDDLEHIPVNIQARIRRAIENRLQTEPTRYGSRLRRSLIGLWKLRVGDYRIGYEVEGRIVRIWIIAHRKEVYPELLRRRRPRLN